MSEEDDTYSTIFTALKHPIRRKILRRLQSSPATYTELLNELTIENGLLNYHLESVKELLTKQEDGRYVLNEFGRAGVQLLRRVEEPAAINATVSSSRQSQLLKMLSIAVIIILSFSTWSLYSSNQVLKADIVDQRNQIETLQSYIQTLTTGANTETSIFKLTLDKQEYHVTDGIIATYLFENTGDFPITFTPPELVDIKGGYVGLNPAGGEGWIEKISAPRTWMTDNVTVPPHSIKVIDHLGFQTDRVGLFEIVCNGFIKRVMILP